MERRRVGLVSTGAPARQHSDILTEDGEKVTPSCGVCKLQPRQHAEHCPAVQRSIDVVPPQWRPCSAMYAGQNRVVLLQIGEISSGAFSPCLKKNIAMGYVQKGHGKAGTKLKVRF